MSNTPQKNRYYKSSRIQEITYNRQAADMFQRFTKHLGATISKKTGLPVFTSYNVWMHAPTLEHPEANFKIQLGNGHSGSIFATVSIDEYYTLLQEQLDWIEKFKPYINLARNNSLELKRRKHIHNTIGSVLGDPDLPTDPIELALVEKIQTSGLPDTPKSSVPLWDESYLKSKLESLIRDFHNTNSHELKEYYFSQMMKLLPTPELINNLRKILYSGETSDELFQSPPNYKSIVDYLNDTSTDEDTEIELTSDPSIKPFKPQQMPIDIDLDLLYNPETTYLPSEESSDTKEV